MASAVDNASTASAAAASSSSSPPSSSGAAGDPHALSRARLPLFLNRALVNIKLGDHAAAEWDTTQALELLAAGLGSVDDAPTHAGREALASYAAGLRHKALFRRALARLGRADAETAKEACVPRQYWDSGRVRDTLSLALADLWGVVGAEDGGGHDGDKGGEREPEGGATIRAASSSSSQATCSDGLTGRVVHVGRSNDADASSSSLRRLIVRASSGDGGGPPLDPAVFAALQRLRTLWVWLSAYERTAAAEVTRALRGSILGGGVQAGGSAARRQRELVREGEGSGGSMNFDDLPELVP